MASVAARPVLAPAMRGQSGKLGGGKRKDKGGVSLAATHGDGSTRLVAGRRLRAPP